MRKQLFVVLLGLFTEMSDNTAHVLASTSRWMGLTQMSIIPIDFFYRCVFLSIPGLQRTI